MHTLEVIWHVFVLACGVVFIATAILNALLRRIPKATVEQWERHRPRLANTLRLLRAGGSDLSKGCAVLYCLLRGQPWPPAIDRIIAAFLVPPAEAAAATATAPIPTPTPATPAAPVTTGGNP